ncbi:MAG: tRNA lysidine(34) synthetase TilS [Crocinitomicaceae bacterium]|nr:tRNA lysidine(34) synthetase TilS [Crocinitomicaceae bacterium]
MSSIINHIDEKWNRLQGKNIFVACSGGVDSTVLAITLKRLGFKVTVLHMNYQLRGNDSELDALFVKSFCRREKITCLQKNINLQEELNNGGNLQELARIARYNWFHHIINQHTDNYIALGHNQDDQIETFFLNLARKSGIMGLACMLNEHKHVIRPLLHFSRNEIEQFAKKEEINWREDTSNASNKYNRNKLRNVILPEIRKQLPELNSSVLTLIEAFQNKQGIIESEIQNLTNDFKQYGQISMHSLSLLDDYKLIEFLRQNGQPGSLLEDFKKIINSEKGKKIAWSETWLISDTDYLVLDFQHKFKLPLLSTKEVKSLPTEFDKKSIYLDKDKLSGDLKVRKWKNGDRIKPIGMKGSKLISDIIKDAKVSPSAKKNILVIHDDKCIHWCYQLTVGRTAIASENSKKIIRVTTS